MVFGFGRGTGWVCGLAVWILGFERLCWVMGGCVWGLGTVVCGWAG